MGDGLYSMPGSISETSTPPTHYPNSPTNQRPGLPPSFATPQRRPSPPPRNCTTTAKIRIGRDEAPIDRENSGRPGFSQARSMSVPESREYSSRSRHLSTETQEDGRRDQVVLSGSLEPGQVETGPSATRNLGFTVGSASVVSLYEAPHLQCLEQIKSHTDRLVEEAKTLTAGLVKEANQRGRKIMTVRTDNQVLRLENENLSVRNTELESKNGKLQRKNDDLNTINNLQKSSLAKFLDRHPKFGRVVTVLGGVFSLTLAGLGAKLAGFSIGALVIGTAAGVWPVLVAILGVAALVGGAVLLHLCYQKFRDYGNQSKVSERLTRARNLPQNV